MYVRQPSQNNSRVKLPDNYGGNAFSAQSYNDMPPPARQSVRPDSQAPYEGDYPHAEPTPKSSPYAEQLRGLVYAPSRSPYIDQDDIAPPSPPDTEDRAIDHAAVEVKQSGQTPSIFSSLIPKGFPSGNFPFGHGIGGEELLILGLMLLIYISGAEKGEVDSEFIILLGLLLFAG